MTESAEQSETPGIGTERTYTLPSGSVIHGVHPIADCTGRHCPLHNPSEHALSIGKLHWRGDRGIMERICKHGIGHPDPDQTEYWLTFMSKDDVGWYTVHGCDGCCARSECPLHNPSEHALAHEREHDGWLYCVCYDTECPDGGCVIPPPCPVCRKEQTDGSDQTTQSAQQGTQRPS